MKMKVKSNKRRGEKKKKMVCVGLCVSVIVIVIVNECVRENRVHEFSTVELFDRRHGRNSGRPGAQLALGTRRTS